LTNCIAVTCYVSIQVSKDSVEVITNRANILKLGLKVETKQVNCQLISREVTDMSPDILKNIVSILRESPLYETVSVEEKCSSIKRLAENYSFLEDGNGEDIVGYESSWADIIQTSR